MSASTGLLACVVVQAEPAPLTGCLCGTTHAAWCVCLCSYLPGVHEAAKQHLEQLEGSRKLFLAANSLSIAQRQLLYAHDELSMALLRITTRAEGEQVGAAPLGLQDQQKPCGVLLTRSVPLLGVREQLTCPHRPSAMSCVHNAAGVQENLHSCHPVMVCCAVPCRCRRTRPCTSCRVLSRC